MLHNGQGKRKRFRACLPAETVSRVLALACGMPGRAKESVRFRAFVPVPVGIPAFGGVSDAPSPAVPGVLT